MIQTDIGLLSSIGLFFGILAAYATGSYLKERWAAEPNNDNSASGLLDSAVYGLLGLLIAFTFSGAGERFNYRREQVFNEANAIGTAYLRLDLLKAEFQPELRQLFKYYLDARLDMTRKLPDQKASADAITQANALQGQIWPIAVKACQDSGSIPATTLLLSALNEMFDIANMRNNVRLEMHPPAIIFVMLFGLALISALLAGYTARGDRKQNWVHIVAFTLIIAGTVNVIIDIEYPRQGFIRIDSVDRVFVELKQSMK